MESETVTRHCAVAAAVPQSLSHVWLPATPRTAAHQACLSFTVARVCSNSCPLSRWCYLTITSSATPFSFCLQSFPASGSFPMSWLLFASGGQSIEASASVLPIDIQGWFPLRLTGLILQFTGLPFSSTTIQKQQLMFLINWCSAFFMVQLSH